MKRSGMGAQSKIVAEKAFDGYVLGRLIRLRLAGYSIPEKYGLPEALASRITAGEIIDSMESLEQAQAALSVLEDEILSLRQARNT